MSIIHGLIAHGTTIVGEFKNNGEIDDLTGRKTSWGKNKCF